MGGRNNYLLPVSKYDEDSITYRLIKRMRKQVWLDSALVYKPRRKPRIRYAITNTVTSQLLSSIGVSSRSAFLLRRRATRHNAVTAIMQQSRGLRFGHFIGRQYTASSFTIRRDKSFRLRTTWGRYPGMSVFTIDFLRNPEWEFQSYRVQRPDGTVVYITAAQVMQWHYETLADDSTWYDPDPNLDRGQLRSKYERWLRACLRTMWPDRSPEMEEAIEGVTPHSFRPGFSLDMQEENADMSTIMADGRWKTKRAAETYLRWPALHTAGNTGRRRSFTDATEQLILSQAGYTAR